MKRAILMPIHQFFPIIGGAEQQAQRLAANLCCRGHKVTVLTGRWDPKFPRREVIDGIDVNRLFTFWPVMFSLGRLSILRQYAFEAGLLWYHVRHRKRIDIVHVHQALHVAAFSTFIAKLLGKKVIIKVGCGGELSDLKMMKGCRITPFGEYFWSFIKTCDRIVAINSEIEEELLADGFSRKQVVRIPNGIPLEKITVKELYGITSGPHLVSVGRLDSQKGFDILVDALAGSLLAGYRCSIYGTGTEKDNLELQIAEKGVADKVFLQGLVFDMPARLPNHDIFILASRAEGLSNALLEAMATGMPCVATNIGGNCDLLYPEGKGVTVPMGEFLVGANGILVNSDDPVGLRRAIEALAVDHELRERLGTEARRWALEHCSLDKVAERYLSLYDELLQTHTSQLP